MKQSSKARWLRLAAPIAIDRPDRGCLLERGASSAPSAAAHHERAAPRARRPGAAAGTIHVSIVNKDMTAGRDQGRDHG